MECLKYTVFLGFLSSVSEGALLSELPAFATKARALISPSVRHFSTRARGFTTVSPTTGDIINLPGDFADPRRDTAFKQLLSGEENDPVTLSFLNTFVPGLHAKRVEAIRLASNFLPVLPGKRTKQTFMDFHVKSESGEHYIVEMQARRHDSFDERALYYGCYVYSHQLEESDLKRADWFRYLRPLIAIQVLDYDTGRLRGIGESDALVRRQKDNPIPAEVYKKHYLLKDQYSGQVMDHLQLIQIELPRAPNLFPPKKEFTSEEWWLSLLKHAGKYEKNALVNYQIPEVFSQALSRLDYSKWNPRLVSEYIDDLADLDLYKESLEVERTEGMKKGIEKGAETKSKEIALKMLKRNRPMDEIVEDTGLSMAEIQALKDSGK